MIRVSPENDAGRLLIAICNQPGRLDCEAAGQLLWKPKITGTVDYLRIRKIMISEGKTWSKRASSLFHRLQERGLIEREKPPMVGPGYTPGVEEDLESPYSELLSKLVRKTPSTIGAWVGSAPAGHIQRALRELAERELVILPSQRWPSEAGRELVASWGVHG
jgi:hypothetical protein